MLSSKEQIGKLDRKIIIQTKTNASDEYNQPISTWTTFANPWAKVQDGSGSESFQADQLTAYRDTVFTIRYLSGLNETMRILYNYQYYNIRLIKRPDRNRFVELTGVLLDDPEEEPEEVGAGFTSGFSSGYNVS